MSILRQFIYKQPVKNAFHHYMFSRWQVTSSLLKSAVAMSLVFILFFCACIIPKGTQKGKPFVFKTNIRVDGSFTNDEKQNLESKLNNQLDDSLQVRTIASFGSLHPFAIFYKKLINPPVFDSVNVSRSKIFMISLLNSLGYYDPAIMDTFKTDTVKDQYRTTINFRVKPGKNLKFDSIGYKLETPELEALALQNIKGSLLKKGQPFSKQVVSSEIDRLVDIFRNNGYYKISGKDIYAEKDTVLAALLDPTLDPFQQAQLIEELRKKRQNPTITLVIKQRPVTDSGTIQKYYIGTVTVYPVMKLIPDTLNLVKTDTVFQNGITFISKYNKFKLPFLNRNVYLRPNKLYKLDDYNKTLNRFNIQLGAWQTASIELAESEAVDSLVNVTIRLYPAKRVKMSINLEGSYNTNDILASNLFGVDLNLGLRDRNAFKESVLRTTNLRGGIEFGTGLIQTKELSLTHSIYFPHMIPYTSLIENWKYDNLNTVVSGNASYTKRLNFFTLKAAGASWGYEWSKSNKEKKSKRSYIWRFPNIEYANLTKTDSLDTLIASTPTLIEAFKTGFIFSTQFIYSSVRQIGKQTNFLRISTEESGGLLGLIPFFDYGELDRFVKGDIEFRHHIDYSNTQLAMRLYAGAGYEYGGGKGPDQILPFYKAYYGGGPGFIGTSSMRGWQVRQLGLGSSKFYDTGNNTLLDRFGDIQLEGNIEYRFPLGTIYSFKILSAVYTDIGNIWDRHPIDTTSVAQGSDFNIGRFYKEFAVDAGTGLRIDFGYFLIRFDWAYKIRDPQRLDYPNRWFYNMSLSDGQFQLGIGYPF
jgi:outer membrane protein insertion porin family